MDGKEIISPDAAARILAKIAAYNEERVAVEARYGRQRLIAWGVTALSAVAFTAAAWLFPIPVREPHLAYIFAAIGVFVVYLHSSGMAKDPKKWFQQAARDRLFPQIFSFVDDFHYRRGGGPASLGRMSVSLTGKYKRSSIDDVMTGSYAGFRFEIYEARLYTPHDDGDSVAFQGVVAAFPLESPFPGTFLAVKDKGPVARFLRGFFADDSLAAVQSGDAGLDEIYEFRSTDPEAAAAMLNGRLAEALKWLRRRWPREPARLALIGSDGFLLLPSERNFFELPGIATELDYRRHVEPIVRDFLSLVTTASLVKEASAPQVS